MIPVHLYDSRSKQLLEVGMDENKKTYLYVCGPTVYNHAHIGNARPLMVFDTLRRTLKACGYDVIFISNYTDVDDKIIQAAKKEQISEYELTSKYIQAYEKLRKDLNVLLPDYTPKVTENMDKIIDFIKELVQNKFAYVVDGDVYFRVSKIKEYGEISNRNIEDLKVGARIEENEKKENPLDFTLWKKTTEGIQWDSPWSKGRPGWHTECVVMISNLTPHTHVQIHGGGMDLKFPHHENEQAQAYAYCHHPLADIWMHNGMININHEKMSKSLNNFILAKDLIATYGGNVLRWIMNSTHYRAPINFSDEVFNNAISELNKVYTPLKQANLKLQVESSISFPLSIDEEKYDLFLKALADDLNTSLAISILFEELKKLNMTLRQKTIDFKVLAKSLNTCNHMLSILGMEEVNKIFTEEEKNLYHQWNDFKKNQMYEQADQLRKELIKKGIL